MEERIRTGAGDDRAERAFLAGVIVDGRRGLDEDPLRELRSLAEAAGAEVVGYLAQRRARPDGRYYLGKGKVEELREEADLQEADLVILDNDLSPAQIRNLEKALERRVVDRSELILDIFARRAQTKQAKAQVELAQLQYTMPRLRRMWSHLERTEGAIGTRGPGETQLETDRRIIRRKIRDLKRELRVYEERKQRELAGRTAHLQACLVGYTNAGKSTLLNQITGASEYVADQLFATLDTRTRKWRLSDGRHILLSDTVGFVRDLPHHLVASFHATLEEARKADLLLVVIDASDPQAPEQVAAVDSVLHEVVSDDLPRLGVLNQTDRLQNMMELQVLRSGFARSVAVSARTGEGLADLDGALRRFLDERSREMRMEVFAGDGQALALLKEAGVVLEESYTEDRYRVRLRVTDRDLGRLRNELGSRLELVAD